MKNANVLILVNRTKDNDLEISKEVIIFLQSQKCNVYVEKRLSNDINNVLVYNEDIIIDFAIILGGDGTLLNFAHNYSNLGFPFFGINLGRVGCLTEATIDNYRDKLTKILADDYFIEERNTIECRVTNGVDKDITSLAFNEVCLQRGKFYKMLLINMLVNNNNCTSFYADGVVVATSTGSSAYSLSCGGPLLLPSAKNFVITPISPQLRTITSLVINDTDIISFDLLEEKNKESFEVEKPIIVIDGYKIVEINRDDQIDIRKSSKILKIIKVERHASLFEPTIKIAMSSQNMNHGGKK